MKIPNRLGTFAIVLGFVALANASGATPANRVALTKYFDKYMAKNIATCTTCHLPTSSSTPPTSLKEFPHNAFGSRLRLAVAELQTLGKKTDLATRIQYIAHEDSDGDGVDNLTELLLGHSPGNSKDKPTAEELKTATAKRAEFAKFLASYRWQPFEAVHRPSVPKSKIAALNGNPIDAFLQAEREKRGLVARPEATKAVLLRRVFLDLVGVSPTPGDVAAFEADNSPNAYEKVVDRLLSSPKYGERWGRQWMDVWRYSDWAGWADGGQIRDSQPHIWRWRDWIVESLNADKGYDRMVQEMLAGDELAPQDPDILRATGFLVRNYKLLSREQWMDDTVGHTSKAFLGVTMNCAKCHDHMYDPITQQDYYKIRAIFEPHNVRIDRVAGETDTAKNGLCLAYDADVKTQTYLFPRGDDRNPDKNQPMLPGVPSALGGTLQISPVKLPYIFSHPDSRKFVREDLVAVLQKKYNDAVKAMHDQGLQTRIHTAEQPALYAVSVAQAHLQALVTVLAVEQLEEEGKKQSDEWIVAAKAAMEAQRRETVAEANLNRDSANLALQSAATETAKTAAKSRLAEAEKNLAAALVELKKPATTEYKPRQLATYPSESSGRRLAFARWLTDRQNPLTARVAVNHIWARHFGVGIVPSLSDFGRNGRAPSNPQLLDWLANELMAKNWKMKSIHRLMVTSRAYKMASTPDAANLKKDPDNVALWRMNSRRMEAELVRDNLLYVAGSLDETHGGPEIDQNLALTSHRRSIYLRHAAEKQAEFLQIFDGPNVTECYERKPSVMPQQALALANSALAQEQSRVLAEILSERTGKDSTKFVSEAFMQVLSRRATTQESAACVAFVKEQANKFRNLTNNSPKIEQPRSIGTIASIRSAGKPSGDPEQRARENLVLVLFNHNDFVTIR